MVARDTSKMKSQRVSAHHFDDAFAVQSRGMGVKIWTKSAPKRLGVKRNRLGNWKRGVEKVDKATKDCLKSLKLLHDAGEIDRAALLSARGRILSARDAAEREEIVRNLIRNVGKRHKTAKLLNS